MQVPSYLQDLLGPETPPPAAPVLADPPAPRQPAALGLKTPTYLRDLLGPPAPAPHPSDAGRALAAHRWSKAKTERDLTTQLAEDNPDQFAPQAPPLQRSGRPNPAASGLPTAQAQGTPPGEEVGTGPLDVLREGAGSFAANVAETITQIPELPGRALKAAIIDPLVSAVAVAAPPRPGAGPGMAEMAAQRAVAGAELEAPAPEIPGYSPFARQIEEVAAKQEERWAQAASGLPTPVAAGLNWAKQTSELLLDPLNWVGGEAVAGATRGAEAVEAAKISAAALEPEAKDAAVGLLHRLRRSLAGKLAPEQAARIRELEQALVGKEVERRSAERAAHTDPLTGLANRRALDRALPAAEADPDTAVLVFDANNFGKINKLASQEAGDAALKDLAGAVRRAATEHGYGERVFRRGGDEMVVLAPKDTADAIRARAEELFGERTFGEGDGAVRVSLTGTAGDTFAEADEALQAAKTARKARPADAAPEIPPETPPVGTPGAAEAVSTPEPAYPLPEPEIGPQIAAEAPIAAPVEPAGPTTSIKNAVVDAERAARGAPAIEQAVRKAWPESFDQGARLADAPTFRDDVRRLAYEPIKKAVRDEDQAALAIDRMRLQNAHRELMDQIDTATAAGDDAAAAEGRLKLANLEDAINDNDLADRRTGTSLGRGLQIRRAVIRQDYSLARLKQRARIAANVRRGEELPGFVQRRLETLSKKLEEATASLERYESGEAQREAEKVVKAMERETRHQARRAGRVATRGELDAEFSGLAGEFSKISKEIARGTRPLAIIDPDAVAIIGRMAKNRVQAGIVGIEELVDSIYQVVRHHMDGVTPRDVRDAISGYGKTSQPSKDELAKNLREAKAQMRLVSALEDAEGGVRPLKSGYQRGEQSQKVRELRRKVNEAMKEHGLDALSEDPERQMRTALGAKKSRLRNEIQDIEKQIAAGKKSPPKAKAPVQLDEEARALQVRRDALKQQLAELEGPQPPRQLTDEQRLSALKNRLAKRQEELKRQIAASDYAKKPRRPAVQLDEDARTLQSEVNQLKEHADREIARLAYKNKSGYEKALDATVAWRRGAGALSSVSTGFKLSAAVAMRVVGTPLEELAGAGLSLVPGIRQISQLAAREGGGLSLKAEAKALAETFSRGTLRDMKLALKTGKTSIEHAYGAAAGDIVGERAVGAGPLRFLDYIGHAHKMLKTPALRNEFARSFAKRAEFVARNRGNIADPVVQAELHAAALNDAYRAILQQDNALSGFFASGKRSLRSRGKAAKAAHAALDFTLPITKVPVNYVGEATSFLAGGPKAALAYVFHGGLGNMDAATAEYIMRNLKKQTVGAAFFAIGYANRDALGGFYRRGEGEPEPGKPEHGEINVAGRFNIPHTLLHHPAIELLQAGASYGKILDAYGEEPGATAAGAHLVYTGLKGQVPYFEEMKSFNKADESAGNAQRYVGGMERALLPPDLQRQARIWDTEEETSGLRKVAQSFGLKTTHPVKRYPRGLLEELLIGVPGLRQRVPSEKE